MRLLVAFDGSDGGRDALELARVLAAPEQEASALVVTVLHAGPLPMEYALLNAEEATEAEPFFEEARERLSGMAVETHAYGGGSPAGILTTLAERDDFDAIVVGSPHRGALGRVMLGSVAMSLLNGAPTDVAVAPKGYVEAHHETLRDIAVGYDGTPEAKVALRAGRSPGEALRRQDQAHHRGQAPGRSAGDGAGGLRTGVSAGARQGHPRGPRLGRFRARRRAHPTRRRSGPRACESVRGGSRPAGRRVSRLRAIDAGPPRLGLEKGHSRRPLSRARRATAMSGGSQTSAVIRPIAPGRVGTRLRAAPPLRRRACRRQGREPRRADRRGPAGSPRLRGERCRLCRVLRRQRPAFADRGATGRGRRRGHRPARSRGGRDPLDDRDRAPARVARRRRSARPT